MEVNEAVIVSTARTAIGTIGLFARPPFLCFATSLGLMR
jgi:hypothetical protein